MKNIFISQHRKWPAQGTSTVPTVSAHFRSLSNQWCPLLSHCEYAPLSCRLSLAIMDKHDVIHKKPEIHSVSQQVTVITYCNVTSMCSLRWHFTNKSVAGAPYSIKSYSRSLDTMVKSAMTETCSAVLRSRRNCSSDGAERTDDGTHGRAFHARAVVTVT